MKVLRAFGDDCSAVDFERSNHSPNDIYKMIKQGVNPSELFDFHVEFKIYEFGEVDSKFIDFVRNKIQDYDSAKSDNFYIIDES